MSRDLIHVRHLCLRILAKHGEPKRAMEIPPKKHLLWTPGVLTREGAGWVACFLHFGGGNEPKSGEVNSGVRQRFPVHDEV